MVTLYIKNACKEFIKKQTDGFTQKYKREDIVKFYRQHFGDNKALFEIKNGKCIPHCKIDRNNMDSRSTLVYYLLVHTAKKYKIKDTIIVINLADGYYNGWCPCFNWAIPDGIPGFIFPHFDILYFSNGLITKKNIKVLNNSRDGTIDEIRNTFYAIPKKRLTIQDIYFKGGPTTKNSNQLREMLEKSKQPVIVVDLDNDNPEPIYVLKDHKYLLDLPGFKPQSLRFKYLFFTGRNIIRISFYNSQYGETSYYKQFIDAFVEENVDYIHLAYNIDYFTKLTHQTYNTIETDIVKVVAKMEKNPAIRRKIAKNGAEKGLKITFDNTLYYISELLNAYTKCLLEI